MNLKEKQFIEKLIYKYSKSNKKKYFLTPDSFSNEDIIAGAKTLLKKQITMSVLTKKFEKEFARYVGAKYALMVNSGSSANLLAFFALINPMKNKNYADGLFLMQTLLLPFLLALIVSPLANSKEGLAEFQPMDVFELEWATDPRVSPNGKTIVYVRKSNDIMKDRERSNLWPPLAMSAARMRSLQRVA